MSTWLKSLFYSLFDKYTYDYSPEANIHYIYGFSEPASEKMQTIIEMYHNTVLILSYILISIILVLFYIIYYFGIRRGIPYPIHFSKSVEYLIDALVVFAPIIIIYYLTVPAVGFIIHSDRAISYVDTIFTIEIVGHQWYWTYVLNYLENPFVFQLLFLLTHPGANVDFIPTNELKLEFDQLIDLETRKATRCFEVNKHLVLPTHALIRCILTSEDVIHSWALPQLGIKLDAIPGRVQSFMLKSDYSGVFYGQCSELCGVNHAFMPIVVEFVESDSYFDWLTKEFSYRPYKFLVDYLS